MSKRRWNELKVLTLKALTNGSMTSKELALRLGIERANAQMVLYRLYRQGLLERSQIPTAYYRKPFQYIITSRGLGRLEYLERFKE